MDQAAPAHQELLWQFRERRIAVSVYVLVAVLKKRLDLDASLYTILQVLSLTIFEKTTLLQILTESKNPFHNHHRNRGKTPGG